MSSPAPLSSVSKIPFFVAAGLFATAAVFISRVTTTKLDALELACFGTCLAAAGACAAVPFVRASRPTGKPAAEVLPDQITAAIDARLAAALPAFTAQLAEALAALDDKRRAEILLAVAENPALRPIDSDTVPAASGKPRLGRGLEGLIRGNTPKPPSASAPASVADADQAAA